MFRKMSVLVGLLLTVMMLTTISFADDSVMNLANDEKEQLPLVKMDFDHNDKRIHTKEVKLADGTVLTLTAKPVSSPMSFMSSSYFI